jgi:multidrug transporter EmrE-like cation transporter
LTLLNVTLQVTCAVLIKAATLPKHIGALSLLIVVVVLALNFGRFVLWQAIHRRYDLSVAYPASALFFPCVVVASYFFGERVDAAKIWGAALVTLGVAILMIQSRGRLHEAEKLASKAAP